MMFHGSFFWMVRYRGRISLLSSRLSQPGNPFEARLVRHQTPQAQVLVLFCWWWLCWEPSELLEQFWIFTSNCCTRGDQMLQLSHYSPHHCGVFVFLLASRLPPSVVRRPSSAALTVDLTQLISRTTHLTHNSSHTQLISHTTHRISHTTHLIHNSSHTQLISHTTHLITSYTTHLTHTHITKLISHNSSQLISHNSSHTTHLTQLISRTSSHRRVAWQAQYTEPSDGGAARIGAAVAAATCCVAGAVQSGCLLCSRRSTQSLLQELRRGLAPQWPRLTCCVAGAVQRASWRSCGADWRRRGRGCLLCGRLSTESLLKELWRGLAPPWPRLVVAWQAQYTTPPEGAAARIGAAVAAAAWCVAGAVQRASWRSCGADWRRRGRG